MANGKLEVSITVVIPVLDEELRIADRLREVQGFADVVVVDGGSKDRTPSLVRAEEKLRPGLRLVKGPRGRARQMNLGASLSRREVLLFLHADCSLPPGAQDEIEQALLDPGVVAGAFRTWHFADEGQSAPWLHVADLRSRYSGLPYGDQALFVRRAVFERLGGFPDQPLMEDLELSRRLRRVGKIVILRSSVRVSGRRFLRHPVRSTLIVNLFPLLYRLGVPPRALARYYEEIR